MDVRDVYRDVLLSYLPEEGLNELVMPIRRSRQHTSGAIGFGESVDPNSAYPAIQPYRPVMGDRSRLYFTPDVLDPEFLGFEANWRLVVNRDGGPTILPASAISRLESEQRIACAMEVIRKSVTLATRINDLRKEGAVKPIRVSLNVSSELLRDRFREKLLSIVGEPDREHTVLELLEDMELTDDDLVKIRRLVEDGFKIALDDLGRGSSLKILESLQNASIPIHEIKIDGRDTVEIARGQFDHINNILEQALGCGINRVVFEGVPRGLTVRELKEVIRYLKSHPLGRKFKKEAIFEGGIA